MYENICLYCKNSLTYFRSTILISFSYLGLGLMSGRLQVLGGREGEEGKWELSLNRCRNIPYFTCVCVVGMGWGGG